MNERVRCEIADGVADVRMTRPDKMNALDSAMFRALLEVGERLKTTKGVRAVVLSGEGRAFCAGLDLSAMAVLAGGPRPDGDRFNPLDMAPSGMAHLAQQICWQWQEIEVPVIAAVHGVAFGGGIQLALGADIRLVAADARLSVMEIKWGLIPDMTGTHRLSQVVRADVALELVASGRIVTGTEAVRIGLATRVCTDPYAEALALAREIASKSPSAVRAGKALLRSAFGGADAATQLAEERRVVVTLIGGEDQREAVAAGLSNRPAVFIDR